MKIPNDCIYALSVCLVWTRDLYFPFFLNKASILLFYILSQTEGAFWMPSYTSLKKIQHFV